jgi:hypothetical protein
MKLWNKMRLRDRLNHGNYDRIAIWSNGKWVEARDNIDVYMDEYKPIEFISREFRGEMTHKEITDLFRALEIMN